MRNEASALVERFRRSFRLQGPRLVVKVHVNSLEFYKCCFIRSIHSLSSLHCTDRHLSFEACLDARADHLNARLLLLLGFYLCLRSEAAFAHINLEA